MKEKSRCRYVYYLIRSQLFRLKLNSSGNGIETYANRRVMSPEETNEWIKDKIRSGKPFVAARFGGTEMRCMTKHYEKKLLKKPYLKRIDSYICMLSGFFPNDFEKIDRFCTMLWNDSNKIDLLGIWHVAMEEYFVTEFMQNTEVTPLEALEPYYYNNPWSEALEGKRVLVIHPFAESIRKQYLNRDKIFQDERILPEFTLVTYKAVQTLANQKDERFQDWFEALDYMAREIEKIDFDIAIIGCGAYGMPLAIRIKEMGKQAIHLGGATQILFGIKGKRWEENSRISKMFNEYWIRPSQNEVIRDGNKIEGGCYW